MAYVDYLQKEMGVSGTVSSFISLSSKDDANGYLQLAIFITSDIG